VALFETGDFVAVFADEFGDPRRGVHDHVGGDDVFEVFDLFGERFDEGEGDFGIFEKLFFEEFVVDDESSAVGFEFRRCGVSHMLQVDDFGDDVDGKKVVQNHFWLLIKIW